jgi:hypothetical protein
MFLDLETLGFLGRPLFLIGLLLPTAPGEARILQYLARDYSEEPAILRTFLRRHAHRRVWVTFNGKAFDLPFLRERCRYHRLPDPVPPEHVDLLHAARRTWKEVLPDCRLKTLESLVCGIWRRDDLGGARVPEAYHAFVRTGEAETLVRILEHNRQDLVTLGRLYRALFG